jgi:hypothetical protein
MESTAAQQTAPATFDPDTALIALTDLPTGWAAEDEPESQDDFCGLGSGVTAELRERAADIATAGYAEGGDAPALAHLVGAFAPNRAESTFDEFEAAMTDCPPLESDGVTWEPARVSFPALGDESTALLLSGETEGFELSAYYVVIRVEDGLAVVGYGGFAPDVAEVEKYARLATRKLQEAQEPSP